jgi:hypothetical protein
MKLFGSTFWVVVELVVCLAAMPTVMSFATSGLLRLGKRGKTLFHAGERVRPWAQGCQGIYVCIGI